MVHAVVGSRRSVLVLELCLRDGRGRRGSCGTLDLAVGGGVGIEAGAVEALPELADGCGGE